MPRVDDKGDYSRWAMKGVAWGIRKAAATVDIRMPCKGLLQAAEGRISRTQE